MSESKILKYKKKLAQCQDGDGDKKRLYQKKIAIYESKSLLHPHTYPRLYTQRAHRGGDYMESEKKLKDLHQDFKKNIQEYQTNATAIATKSNQEFDKYEEIKIDVAESQKVINDITSYLNVIDANISTLKKIDSDIPSLNLGNMYEELCFITGISDLPDGKNIDDRLLKKNEINIQYFCPNRFMTQSVINNIKKKLANLIISGNEVTPYCLRIWQMSNLINITFYNTLTNLVSELTKTISDDKLLSNSFGDINKIVDDNIIKYVYSILFFTNNKTYIDMLIKRNDMPINYNILIRRLRVLLPGVPTTSLPNW